MKVNFKSTVVFEKTYEAIFTGSERFIIHQGGSRSSKSYSVCQVLILLALKEKGVVISIVRKTFPSLRASIMRDFFSILKQHNIYDVKRHNKTEHTYTFKNGSVVEFFSVDNEEKVRGRKRDYCFVDEANQIFRDDFTQLNLRTSKKLIFGYNPSDNSSWLYDLPQESTLMIKSTYKDNPFWKKRL